MVQMAQKRILLLRIGKNTNEFNSSSGLNFFINMFMSINKQKDVKYENRNLNFHEFQCEKS